MEELIPFKGNSMWPLIQDGDQLKVKFYNKPKSLSELTDGLLYFYNDGDEWVVHRGIVKGNIVFCLKGDWALSKDMGSELKVWGVVEEVVGGTGLMRSSRISMRFKSISSFLSLKHSLSQRSFGKLCKFFLLLINLINRYI